ncbi:hypothetical protein K440DRAFT_664843 [Wilcoxina mikolae CBS 423.85]|nr:hypothetical protein K440DRAFT_664843 [Wilcoxina mikolae CBS 423.85]
MAGIISSYLDSSPLTLLVGADMKRYLVHSSLLAAKSETVRVLCEGDWAETHSQEIDWSEWEEATVKHFLEWIYTGSYTTSECSETSTKMPPIAQECQPTPKPTVQNSELDPFRPMTPLSACVTSYSTSRLDNVPPDASDIPAIFMAHAKLYVFAQYTITAGLKNTALQRLNKILMKLTHPIEDQSIIDCVSKLVEYTYANTNALVNSEEPLRRVISTFCAARYFELQRQPSFQTLLNEGGDFAIDFWAKVGRLVIWDKNREIQMLKEENEKLKGQCTSLHRQNEKLTDENAKLEVSNAYPVANRRKHGRR